MNKLIEIQEGQKVVLVVLLTPLWFRGAQYKAIFGAINQANQ